MDDQAIGQFDTLRDEGRLSASEYRRAVLWLGVKDRTAILKALGKLSAADVRALIGADEQAPGDITVDVQFISGDEVKIYVPANPTGENFAQALAQAYQAPHIRVFKDGKELKRDEHIKGLESGDALQGVQLCVDGLHPEPSFRDGMVVVDVPLLQLQTRAVAGNLGKLENHLGQCPAFTNYMIENNFGTCTFVSSVYELRSLGPSDTSLVTHLSLRGVTVECRVMIDPTWFCF